MGLLDKRTSPIIIVDKDHRFAAKFVATSSDTSEYSDISSEEEVLPQTIKTYAVAEPTVELTINTFWEAIKELEWSNRDDRVIKDAEQRLKNLAPYKKKAISMYYDEIEAIILASEVSNILDERVANEDEIKIIVSHFIALGQEWFEIMMGSPDIISFIIDGKYYQDFYTHMKKVIT